MSTIKGTDLNYIHYMVKKKNTIDTPIFTPNLLVRLWVINQKWWIHINKSEQKVSTTHNLTYQHVVKLGVSIELLFKKKKKNNNKTLLSIENKNELSGP